jgi:hypothetical protein
MLESLIRVAEAHARLMFRDAVAPEVRPHAHREYCILSACTLVNPSPAQQCRTARQHAPAWSALACAPAARKNTT